MDSARYGTPAEPDRESVGRLLWLTAKALARGADARLQARAASHAAWLVLHALVNHGGEGSRQRTLAEHLCIEGPTMTRHLDQLQAGGLIERRPDPDDRRSTRIYSTPEGRRVLKSLWGVMERAEGDLLAGLSQGPDRERSDGLMTARPRQHRSGGRPRVGAGGEASTLGTTTGKEGVTHVR